MSLGTYGFDSRPQYHINYFTHNYLRTGSKVGLGVAGSAAYGNDSPLYGAMDFVRKSERSSGLTQKKETVGWLRRLNPSR